MSDKVCCHLISFLCSGISGEGLIFFISGKSREGCPFFQGYPRFWLTYSFRSPPESPYLHRSLPFWRFKRGGRRNCEILFVDKVIDEGPFYS